jgi:two-component system, cell cycle sensor histidine kinase and response regulator CckA
MDLHPLLHRQLAKHFNTLPGPSPELGAFVTAINDAYRRSDSDRALLERSLDLSSQELLQANADLRAIVRSFPDLFMWLGPDGTILDWRGQDRGCLPLPASALVGQRIQGIPMTAAAKKFGQALRDIARGEQSVTLEYSLARDGKRRDVEARLIKSDGPRVLAIVRDLTHRKVAERALEQSVSMLQATLDSTADGIFVVDNYGRITAFNRRFVEIWGMPEDVLAARDHERAIDHVVTQVVDPDSFLARISELYHDADAESFDEVLLKDGRTLERSSHPQRLAGRSVGRVWSFSDVTAARRAEQALRERDEQLRQSQKMEAIGLLAGGVAHDFNNLLTAITGYAELVLGELRTDDPLRPDIEEILRAGQSAASLTKQLLAFGRRQILQPRIVDLNRIVASTESLLRRLIGEDVRLVTDLAATTSVVHVDPSQVEQVIVNLAVNARDAMPRGGTLRLETALVELRASDFGAAEDAAEGSYLCLTVSDTGTGMSEDVRAHIFEPFFTTKQRGEGTGLGLATVYGIVKQSGGVVRVRSGVGAGTSFEVYFPAVQAAADVDTRPVAAALPRGNETILLAEDQAEVRSVTRSILTRYGYNVIDASNGAEALARAAELHHIDLLLTDVVMPGMSGPELAAALSVIRPNLRVLYASGHAEAGIVRRGTLSAAVAFIQKPFAPGSLLTKVRETLDSDVAGLDSWTDLETPRP